MAEMSEGLSKPYKVQGASHLDHPPEGRKLEEAFKLMAIREDKDKENKEPKTRNLTMVKVGAHGRRWVPVEEEARAIDETTEYHH